MRDKAAAQFVTRAGTIADISDLQQMCIETIQQVCKNDYNEEQLNVWASGIESKERWNLIFENQFVLVAVSGDKKVGFATLDDGKYIDMFYVHRHFQRLGLASLLYSSLEKEAFLQGTTKITANVSRTARPFFERQGFSVEQEQNFELNGVKISNFKMSKMISK